MMACLISCPTMLLVYLDLCSKKQSFLCECPLGYVYVVPFFRVTCWYIVTKILSSRCHRREGKRRRIGTATTRSGLAVPFTLRWLASACERGQICFKNPTTTNNNKGHRAEVLYCGFTTVFSLMQQRRQQHKTYVRKPTYTPPDAFDGGDVDVPAVGVGRFGLVRDASAGGEHVRIRLCALGAIVSLCRGIGGGGTAAAEGYG